MLDCYVFTDLIYVIRFLQGGGVGKYTLERRGRSESVVVIQAVATLLFG